MKMKQTVEEKHFLNLSGEYLVCAELLKRNISASITYGNQKAADIIITKDGRAFVVEVMKRNEMTEWLGIPKGVDNVLLSQLESCKNKWETILNIINR